MARAKDVASLVQSIATVAAIVLGGAWFLWREESAARANLTHQIEQRPLDGEWQWVHLWVGVENAGNTPLRFEKARVLAQQVLPVDARIADSLAKRESPIPKGERLVPWPTLGAPYEEPLELEIAPGEKDSLELDFLVPRSLETIRIYSYFESQAAPPLGWSKTSVHDLTPKREEMGCAGAASPHSHSPGSSH